MQPKKSGTQKEDPDCLDLSLKLSVAYGPNAAMCHYAPTETEFAKVEPKGFFLIDSGGQYWQGTTDITRTIAVGELTQQQKEHFTLVLQGHIRLAMAKFQYGCSGANLDALVRGPLWERGLDLIMEPDTAWISSECARRSSEYQLESARKRKTRQHHTIRGRHAYFQ
mgnify:CR=1 FL=1